MSFSFSFVFSFEEANLSIFNGGLDDTAPSSDTIHRTEMSWAMNLALQVMSYSSVQVQRLGRPHITHGMETRWLALTARAQPARHGPTHAAMYSGHYLVNHAKPYNYSPPPNGQI